jgi:hypothetical protein
MKRRFVVERNNAEPTAQKSLGLMAADLIFVKLASGSTVLVVLG